MIRHKIPAADLKLAYPKVMARCVGISFLLLLVLALMFPSLDMDTSGADSPDPGVNRRADSGNPAEAPPGTRTPRRARRNRQRRCTGRRDH